MRRTPLVLAIVAAARLAAADPFLDAVVSSTVGQGGGGRVADLPGVVLGPPRGGGAFTGSLDTFSLGLGGQIVVAFTDNVVVDGPGPDLTVFENAFLPTGLTTLAPFAEPGTVAVSADGVTWATFACASDRPPYFPGCAGVYPVFASADDAASPSPLAPSTVPIASLVDVPVDAFAPPPGSGGDTFDLADVGLAAIRFVRIDGGADRFGLMGLAGFDLDAIAGLHSVEAAGLPDADGDGIVDAADACPGAADSQADADGDGVGDACDLCPGLTSPDRLDRDADGVGDACDNCPGTPNPDQADADADGAGDACTETPGEPQPDGDADGVPDARDVCIAVADPSQADADADGLGDACDNCPARPNPDQGDTDGDGIANACDPCPNDAACGPAVAPAFVGPSRKRDVESLLTYVTPTGALMTLPAEAAEAAFTVVVSPDVRAGSVTVRVGRRDVTAALAPSIPGSTRVLRIPLTRRRTVVTLRAEDVSSEPGRRRVDLDRFTVKRR